MPLTADEKEKFRIMEEDIQNISTGLAEFKVQLFELKGKVEKMYYALLGSDLVQDGGLIKRISKTEETIHVWDKKMRNITAKTNALYVLGGVVGSAILKIFYDLLTKK